MIDINIDIDVEEEEVSGEGAVCSCAADALVLSLANKGKVDLGYIASAAGISTDEAISELAGAIYQNPVKYNGDELAGWEQSSEYLSGNLAVKYLQAREANSRYPGRFTANVRALKKILPPMLNPEDIYITLGSPWVPVEIINEFFEYIALDRDAYAHFSDVFRRFTKGSKNVVRHSFTGLAHVHKTAPPDYISRVPFSHIYNVKYGTSSMAFPYILEHALNNTPIVITDPKSRYDTSNRIVNPEKTLAANQKKEQLNNIFQEWVWSDRERAAQLRQLYYVKFACNQTRIFDGSFLPFTGLSPEVELYDYQKNAVARILLSPNTLIAHDCGAGKTFELIAACMETRRIHPDSKIMIVVPNNILSQWESTFRTIYPGANIFVVSKKNFDPKKRQDTLAKIRDEDFDAILIPYSCFDMINMSADYYLKRNKEMISRLNSNNGTLIPAVNRRIKSIENQIEKHSQEWIDSLKGISFDELGITNLYVDEAHNYKNAKNVLDQVELGKVSHHRADTLMDKVHYVQRCQGGSGIVFSTGTPITNSLTDLYVMQRFLQEGELELKGISSYQSWLGQFAKEETSFEIDVDTTKYRAVTKFSTFCNIPELTAIVASVTDFHKADNTDGLPDFHGYKDIIVHPSKQFEKYLGELSKRADLVRKHKVRAESDNMLLITTDGRKAALDLRLVMKGVDVLHNTKVEACAEEVFKVYEKTKAFKGTQLVFCDTSVPKKGFNLYDELKDLLVLRGIPKSKIAFVHDSDTDAKREKLFADVREGKIAVLIGSTSKLGIGVNVQEKMAAIHHLDVPWRPADMVQREARLLRPGNTCPEVEIFRYVTSSSFDAYSYQLLEKKQRFISQVVSGQCETRVAGDVDDTVLTYAEVKALAVGNPAMKEKIELTNDLAKLRILQKQELTSRSYMSKELADLPAKIERASCTVEACKKDIETYKKELALQVELSTDEKRDLREMIFEQVRGYRNMPSGKIVARYMGFDLEAPSGMSPKMVIDKRSGGIGKYVYYIYVVGENRYYLELESAGGTLTRINNLLEGLEERLLRYEAIRDNYTTRMEMVKELLDKPGEEYQAEIDDIESRLNVINKKLGVA